MKFLRYIQKKRRSVLAMAALTLFAGPFTAHASNITTKAGVTLKPTNNVYNIEVQKKLSSSVGVNKFKDFDLSQGHIANIQFDKLQSVANLVDNKININGTVNALRDGKIGGNLYFLSPNGIAVGASGVINAGAFTGAAVDKDYFNELSYIDSAGEFMTAISPSNIKYNNDTKKGIDIQGVINAPGGIHLYATKIDIGKDAILRTDVEGVDFKKVVNVEGVDSGITGGLDAPYEGGNIILKARAEHIADDNNFRNISDVSETKWEKVTTRNAIINVDGTIKSAGDVSITAEAETKFSEGSYWNFIGQSNIVNNFLGALGIDCSVDFASKTNKAAVNIGKTADIYSAGDMDISATGNLEVTINATTPALKTGSTTATEWIPATAVTVIKADNKAVVNIDGKLESAGKMAINAEATTSLDATANSATFVTQSDAAKGVKEDSNYIAVGIIDGDTTAEVNINAGDEIKSGEDFEATATTENSISNSTTAATAATSIGSTLVTNNDDVATTTAINVTKYNASATVNVNRDINAENGSIKLEAANTFDNSLEASTVTGREVKPIKNWTEITGPTLMNSITGPLAKSAAEKVVSLFKTLIKSVPSEGGGSTAAKLFNGDYFKLGVTLGVFLQDNNAKVNIGKNANLTAAKDIDISATNEIESLSFAVDATVNNQKSNNSPVMIGLGVLGSNIENNADIVNDGNLTATNGDISINTESGMNYNQFKAVVESVRDAFKEIADDVKSLGKNVANSFTKYESQVNEELDALEKTEDPAEYMQALDDLNEKINETESTGFDSAVKALDSGIKLKSDLENLPSKLTAFLHPSSYTNYYALSAFYAGDEGNKDTKLEAAGSFSINTMLNNSRVVVGENSVITAKNGSVNTNSLAQNRVVAITGMGGEHLTSSEAQNKGVGISVMVGNFKNNAVTAFGKNSQVKAKDISLETKDYSKHVNIIYGNGKADSTSITGMVSHINAPGNAIISLDDSTKLTGNLDKSGKVTAADNVNLNANSENYITSVNGAVTMGNGNGKSLGAAINILNNDGTTSVLVADNGVNSAINDDNIKNLNDAIKDATDENIIVEKKTDLKALKITKTAQDILGSGYTNKLGNASTDKGEINADTFKVKSNSTGTINAIAVEGTENSESHGFADKFNDYVYKGEVQLGYAEDAFK